MNTATQHLAQDPVMAKLIQKIGPIHLRARRVPVFQSLVQAIQEEDAGARAVGEVRSALETVSHFGSPIFVAGCGWGMTASRISSGLSTACNFLDHLHVGIVAGMGAFSHGPKPSSTWYQVV